MPELPEVESVRRMLEAAMAGRRIVACRVLAEKLLKPPVTDPGEFESAVAGRLVEAVRRRGKHLIFALDNGYAVMAHLMMRGHFVLAAPGKPLSAPYLCLIFELDDGLQCCYHDIWRWGEFRFIRDDPQEQKRFVPALAKMGQEPLSESFNGDSLRTRTDGRRTTIKAALLDQQVVAGVGNIYADESLFRAGIQPDRTVGSLRSADWRSLADSIKRVLAEAIDGGGTVSDNFFGPDGRPGRYVPLVYGRGGKECPRCGATLVRTRIAGRGTVYCPHCQS